MPDAAVLVGDPLTFTQRYFIDAVAGLVPRLTTAAALLQPIKVAKTKPVQTMVA